MQEDRDFSALFDAYGVPSASVIASLKDLPHFDKIVEAFHAKTALNNVKHEIVAEAGHEHSVDTEIMVDLQNRWHHKAIAEIGVDLSYKEDGIVHYVIGAEKEKVILIDKTRVRLRFDLPASDRARTYAVVLRAVSQVTFPEGHPILHPETFALIAGTAAAFVQLAKQALAMSFKHGLELHPAKVHKLDAGGASLVSYKLETHSIVYVPTPESSDVWRGWTLDDFIQWYVKSGDLDTKTGMFLHTADVQRDEYGDEFVDVPLLDAKGAPIELSVDTVEAAAKLRLFRYAKIAPAFFLDLLRRAQAPAQFSVSEDVVYNVQVIGESVIERRPGQALSDSQFQLEWVKARDYMERRNVALDSKRASIAEAVLSAVFDPESPFDSLKHRNVAAFDEASWTHIKALYRHMLENDTTVVLPKNEHVKAVVAHLESSVQMF